MDRSEPQTTGKRAKDAASALDQSDQVARRAERFQRDHEIGRRKSLCMEGSQIVPKANSQDALPSRI